MTSSFDLELGAQRLKAILGSRGDQIIANFKAVSPAFADYVVGFAYGDLYTRAGLTDKVREVAAVATLIGQGNTGLPLKSHLHGMLNVGWSKNDVIEVILFLIGYVGFPKAVEAMLTAQEVFDSKN